MRAFATIIDIELLFRKLNLEEKDRALGLLEVVSDILRTEAKKRKKNLDEMAKDESYSNVLKSVTVDIVARCLLTSTVNEPIVQSAQSALGYSVSGTFLNPGGGIFIKNNELSRLGLKAQKMGVINFYED